MLDFKFIQDNWMFIAGGLSETLGISILSIFLAILLAPVVAKGRQAAFLPIRLLSTLYVLLIDATPLLLQIFFIFLALPQLGIFLPGFLSAVLVLGINYGAHMSESFRLGHISLKLSQRETWRSVIPLLTGGFIGVIKDSTLIYVTGFVHDIMWRASRVGRAQFHNLEAFIIAAVIYWMLFIVLSFTLRASKGRKLGAEVGTAHQSSVE